MRVELHSVSHDVRHLVVAPVVHALHRVQDASLHRLQSVDDVRHGTFQYDVARIVEEPVLVHSAQVVRNAVLHLSRIVVAMRRSSGRAHLFVIVVNPLFRSRIKSVFDYFVAHFLGYKVYFHKVTKKSDNPDFVSSFLINAAAFEIKCCFV